MEKITVRMQDAPLCLVCGIPGKRLYAGLPDRTGPVAGTFSFDRCPACGSLWLDPRPVEEDIPACYGDFFASSTGDPGRGSRLPDKRHAAAVRDALREMIVFGHFGYGHLLPGRLQRWLGYVLGCFPALRRKAVYPLKGYLPRRDRRYPGLIVDVGCGAGGYLSWMRRLGWNVLGVEPDPAGAQQAVAKGIPVIQSGFEQAGLASGIAEYVILNHVLEHCVDPRRMIAECWRILKPGGRLVIRTPNPASLGHVFFGPAHYSLDPPRHLFLFSGKSLKVLLGSSVTRRFTVVALSDSAPTVYDNGCSIKRTGRTDRKGIPAARGRGWFAWLETLLCGLGCPCGEEWEVVAEKSEGI